MPSMKHFFTLRNLLLSIVLLTILVCGLTDDSHLEGHSEGESVVTASVSVKQESATLESITVESVTVDITGQAEIASVDSYISDVSSSGSKDEENVPEEAVVGEGTESINEDSVTILEMDSPVTIGEVSESTIEVEAPIVEKESPETGIDDIVANLESELALTLIRLSDKDSEIASLKSGNEDTVANLESKESELALTLIQLSDKDSEIASLKSAILEGQGLAKKFEGEVSQLKEKFGAFKQSAVFNEVKAREVQQILETRMAELESSKETIENVLKSDVATCSDSLQACVGKLFADVPLASAPKEGESESCDTAKCFAGVTAWIEDEYEKSIFKVVIDYVQDQVLYLEKTFKITLFVKQTGETCVIYAQQFGEYCINELAPALQKASIVAINAVISAAHTCFEYTKAGLSALYQHWTVYARPLVDKHIGEPIGEAWTEHVTPIYNAYAAEHVKNARVAFDKWYMENCRDFVMVYIEPAWEFMYRKLNMGLYYVEKFFRDWVEDPEYKLRLYYYVADFFPNLIDKVAVHPILQSVPADKTKLVASMLVFSVLLTLVYLVRKIVMGIIAAVLIVVLSPILIGVYCCAKLIRCCYGPAGGKTAKKGKKNEKNPPQKGSFTGVVPGSESGAKRQPTTVAPPTATGSSGINRIASNDSTSSGGSQRLNALRGQKTSYGSVVPPTRMTPASALRLVPTK
jgi:hypothetical protein